MDKILSDFTKSVRSIVDSYLDIILSFANQIESLLFMLKFRDYAAPLVSKITRKIVLKKSIQNCI